MHAVWLAACLHRAIHIVRGICRVWEMGLITQAPSYMT